MPRFFKDMPSAKKTSSFIATSNKLDKTGFWFNFIPALVALHRPQNIYYFYYAFGSNYIFKRFSLASGLADTKKIMSSGNYELVSCREKANCSNAKKISGRNFFTRWVGKLYNSGGRVCTDIK